jgi:nucleoside-diphosphate-sugar epimerase
LGLVQQSQEAIVPSSVIILGAKGRFGRAATDAFLNAGWKVTAFGRNWDAPQAPKVNRVTGDALDVDVLKSACEGHDVIVNAIHPPYPQWSKVVPVFTKNIIAAARHSGATVMIPGNVYNYGQSMPTVLDEGTARRPSTRKGKLRETMERSFANTSDIQTIILRAGDFIEAAQTGNWFDTHIAAKVPKARVLYPGPLDQMHAWAYLPDMARALVGLAEEQGNLARFETVGFGGYGITGEQLLNAISAQAGRPLKRSKMPWFILRLMAPFSPLMREVLEMRYLWNVPHRIDDSKLRRLLPDWQPTPLVQCMADVVPK